MMVPNRRKGDLMNQEEVLERLKEELELPFPSKIRGKNYSEEDYQQVKPI